MNLKSLIPALSLPIVLASCGNQQANEESTQMDTTKVEVALNHAPDWSKNAMMYEVNVRQYTPEGTLKAFQKSLPRLKEMGVDILWFMPIQPIGVENRKGTLGSYYSIQDYTAVNPSFGTMEDFKSIVDEAHNLGMKVILDWVANHSAFDTKWAKEHPEYYTQDSTGKIIPPNPDWSDVADLNYDNQEMRAEMTASMKYWITEANIDGFRCDVAGEVPLDFWEATIRELRDTKDIFMLAEWDEPKMHSCFNATYAWGFHHVLMEVGKGEMNLDSIRSFVTAEMAKYPADAFKLRFTTNHDENTWKGTEEALFGPLTHNFQALIFTLPGMPLTYSGQESVLDKQLEFFEKDEIEWKNYELADYFKTLDKIREENPALWGGAEGGDLTWLGDNSANGILAFDRVKGDNHIRVIMNCTDKIQSVEAYLNAEGTLTNLVTNAPYEGIRIKPYEFVILKISK